MKRIVSISFGIVLSVIKKSERSFSGKPSRLSALETDGDKKKISRPLLKSWTAKLMRSASAVWMPTCMPENAAMFSRKRFGSWKGQSARPYFDGSGLKHTLERETVAYLDDNHIIDFRNSHVLLVSAVDRFGMAEALNQRAKSIVFGDLLFGLGLPFPLRSWKQAQSLARVLLPVIVRLPIEIIYPTGKKQDENTPKFSKVFEQAEIIAGDFHLIRRYMPPKLQGKIVLTNTTTEADVLELTKRGVTKLITTTPVFEGRSFGTNVMEAVLFTIMGKTPDQLTPDDYRAKLAELDWKPGIQELAK